MLMDGYMLTGRVGVGSHKRVEDELFIIWFVYLCQAKAKEDCWYDDMLICWYQYIGVIMSIYEIITIVPPSHHYYPKDVPGGEKPWLQSKADIKKWWELHRIYDPATCEGKVNKRYILVFLQANLWWPGLRSTTTRQTRTALRSGKPRQTLSTLL